MLPTNRGSKGRVLLAAGVMIVLIAAVDWRLLDAIPLGFLYLVPMLMLGRVLKPWQTVVTAGILTLLTEEFDPFPWTVLTGLPRDTLYFAAFLAIGMFVYDTTRTRRIITEHMLEIERQSEARQDAEEQLHMLIESSPAAVVTASSDGSIVMANEAAHRMLTLPANTLPGLQLQRFFPGLANITRRESAPQQAFRTVMQSRAIREDGETFMAEICFSTYSTRSGPRLAAMILDASEELRTREESSLHQMLAGSRIAVGAVSHEIRNVCGAIGVVHQNLSRNDLLSQNKDFEALGNLVVALERIAAVDLSQYPESNAEVDLSSVLDELRIVIAPALQEYSIASTWKIDPALPLVWADRTSLMQIFLNLTNNGIRALSRAGSDRSLSIAATPSAQGVSIAIVDSGGGVAHPEELFHPFQVGAHASGLGLYLSRAFARAFGGDVRYCHLPGKACFIVDLLSVATPGTSR